MTDEDKAKLRELWDLLEKAGEDLIAYEVKPNGISLFDVQDKFEELFSKELND